jgi:ubiquinone/menaquinone biosynthesis C-methylase UbiE
MDKESAAQLRAYIAAENIVVVAHSAYVAPLFGGDPDAARYVREEIAVCAAAGISGLVVHLPKAPIEAVVKYIPRILCPESSRVRVFLETPAVTPPDTYYETPEKLIALFEALHKIDPDRTLFGLCVDTAHIWTSGVDISGWAATQEWLDRLAPLTEQRISLIFHLNDSRRECGTGPDSHAGLMAGQIWGEYAGHPEASGLAAVIAYACQHRSIVILERKPEAALEADYRLLASMAPSLAATEGPTERTGGRGPTQHTRHLFELVTDECMTDAHVADAARSNPQHLCDSLWEFIVSKFKHHGHSTEMLRSIASHVVHTMADQRRSDLDILEHLRGVFAIKDQAKAQRDRAKDQRNQAKAHRDQAQKYLNEIASTIEAARELRSDLAYLDVGCGDGQLTRAVAHALGLPRERTHACDVRARTLAAEVLAAVTFVANSGSTLPYPDRSIGFITMRMSAHHFIDADAMIREAHRVLTRGGLLLMCDHDIAEGPSAQYRIAFYDIIYALRSCTQITSNSTFDNESERETDMTPQEFLVEYASGAPQYRSMEAWRELVCSHGFKHESRQKNLANRHNLFYSLFRSL